MNKRVNVAKKRDEATEKKSSARTSRVELKAVTAVPAPTAAPAPEEAKPVSKYAAKQIAKIVAPLALAEVRAAFQPTFGKRRHKRGWASL